MLLMMAIPPPVNDDDDDDDDDDDEMMMMAIPIGCTESKSYQGGIKEIPARTQDNHK